MSKQILISLSIVIIGGIILGGLAYFKSEKEESLACPLDVMMCPDGTSVSRSGANCEFGVCKTQTVNMVSTLNEVRVGNSSSSDFLNSTSAPPQRINEAPSSETTPPKTSLISEMVEVATQSVASIFQSIAATVGVTSNTQPAANQPVTQSNQTTSTQTPTTPTSNLNEERFTVVGNNIVDGQGNTVTSIPASVSTETSSSSWETHTVNVIEVGSTTPVVGGVPVVGADGKYYVSENSFGAMEKCEFSNKIFILDVPAETKTLLYEENSSTLSKDDQRACNSEIFLLATEDEKLIIKYHTINTNMTCESTWSEPDKTWYLDVTNLAASLRRYYISHERYSQAEADELECRAALGTTN